MSHPTLATSPFYALVAWGGVDVVVDVLIYASCHVYGALEEKADEAQLHLGPDRLRRGGGELNTWVRITTKKLKYSY